MRLPDHNCMQNQMSHRKTTQSVCSYFIGLLPTLLAVQASSHDTYPSAPAVSKGRTTGVFSSDVVSTYIHVVLRLDVVRCRVLKAAFTCYSRSMGANL